MSQPRNVPIGSLVSAFIACIIGTICLAVAILILVVVIFDVPTTLLDWFGKTFSFFITILFAWIGFLTAFGHARSWPNGMPMTAIAPGKYKGRFLEQCGRCFRVLARPPAARSKSSEQSAEWLYIIDLFDLLGEEVAGSLSPGDKIEFEVFRTKRKKPELRARLCPESADSATSTSS